MQKASKFSLKAVMAVAIAMLCAGAIALVGCSGNSGSKEPVGTMTEEGYVLLNEGQLTIVGSWDFPPFENLEGSEVVGFEIDICQAIADEMGLELNVLSTMKFDSIIPAIAAGGTADMGVSGFTITPARQQEVDFTTPICDTNQAIVVLKGSDIMSQADLAGKNVGGETGTTGIDWANENLTSAASIIPYDEYTAVFAALQSGNVDAVVLDKPVADYYINVAYSDCQVVEEIPTGEQYGFAISKDNPELTAAVNAAIETLHANGTWDTIEHKWFG